MRPLAAVLLFGLAAPTLAADKDEDKAKEAAATFMKAFNARDVDAMMKVADVPFYSSPKGKDTIFEKSDDLKADFKRRVGGLKDFKFSEEVLEVAGVDAFLKKNSGKEDEEEVKNVRRVVGKGGFVVILGKGGKPSGVVLVAIKDGKARVVGLPE